MGRAGAVVVVSVVAAVGAVAGSRCEPEACSGVIWTRWRPWWKAE